MYKKKTKINICYLIKLTKNAISTHSADRRSCTDDFGNIFNVTAGFQSAITKLSIAQNIYIVFMTSTQINSCPLLLTSYVIDTIR